MRMTLKLQATQKMKTTPKMMMKEFTLVLLNFFVVENHPTLSYINL